MVAITKTNEVDYDVNLIQNHTFIYVCRKASARQLWIDWQNKDLIYWSKYQIKETDMRQETASFTSPQYFDLTTGVYCVLISSPYHKNFGGIILSCEYDEEEGMYTYQCQDFSRTYQSKFGLVTNNVTLHRILKYLISRGNLPISGAISDSLAKDYKKVLSGLKPAYQYEQKYYGASKNSNPMTAKYNTIIKDKTYIEAIRDLVYGTGAYTLVYNKPTYSQIETITGGIFTASASNAVAAFKNDGIEIEWKGEGMEEKGYDKKTGKMVVCVNPKWYRPTDVVNLWGDPTKARTKLGWNPQKTSYEQLCAIMAEHDLLLAKKEAGIN